MSVHVIRCIHFLVHFFQLFFFGKKKESKKKKTERPSFKPVSDRLRLGIMLGNPALRSVEAPFVSAFSVLTLAACWVCRSCS